MQASSWLAALVCVLAALVVAQARSMPGHLSPAHAHRAYVRAEPAPALITDFDALLAKYSNSSWVAPTHVDEDEVAGVFLELKAMVRATSKAKAATTVQADGDTPPEKVPVGLCEICVYVLENHEQRQPYLCRGLKDPNYQKICVQTLESMMWWITNEVYWVNYGCERKNGDEVEWVRPCPPTVVCSWLEHLYLRQPYCSPRPDYQKPTGER